MLDVTEPDNLDEVPVYKDKLKHYLSDEVPVVVLANKIDMDPDESYTAKILEYEKKLGHRIFPVSAATGEGIDDVINNLVEKAHDYKLS